MRNTSAMDAYDAYNSQAVLAATPLQLIEMLYRGALQAVQHARSHLASGAIKPRSHQISKAIAILAELSAALDHQQGGDVSRNLGQLYDYLQRLLIEANCGQAERPLLEAERLLAVLLHAWAEMRAATESKTSRTFADLSSRPEPISVSC